MEINPDNYEAFLLDYSEGNLSAEKISELRVFCLLHPELSIDLEQKDLPGVRPDDAVFSDKTWLRKADDNDLLISYLEKQLTLAEEQVLEKRLEAEEALMRDFELLKRTVLAAGLESMPGKSALHRFAEESAVFPLALKYVEGDLALAQQTEFERRFRAEKSLRDEVTAFENTRSQPDLSVIYPEKNRLKRGRVIVMFAQWQAIAAVLLIAFSLVFLLTRNSSPTLPATAANGVRKPATQPLASRSDTLTSMASQPEAAVPGAAKALVPSRLHKNMIRTDLQKKETELAKLEQVPEKEFEEPGSFSEVAPQLAVAPPDSSRPAMIPAEPITTLVAVVEDTDEIDAGGTGNGFWSKAVQLARQANQLGVKSVDGETDGKNRFRLSFNAFSVEKY